MKKNLISAFIVVIVAFAICCFLKKPANQNSPLSVLTNEAIVTTNVLVSLPPLTNPSPQIIVQQSDGIVSTNETSELILSNYETLDDLKQIKSLHEINGFLHLKNWYSESNWITFQLKSINGQPTGFTADTIFALTDRKDDHVHELTLHSPWLDIDGVRQVGLELEKAWGLDPKDFLAWCNKVGNKWVDAPLYSAGNGFPPAPEPYIGFSVRRTTNDEKPWVIVLTIKDN